jgi:high affinity Mn2+ porin
MGQQLDSSKSDRVSVHFQATIIDQLKPAFRAKYSGSNSLITTRESKTSITSTLFLGTRLWKGASIFLNPELAGGEGLSTVFGVADATNGETFRIGNPAPQISIARLFFRQIIDLSPTGTFQSTDINQIAGHVADKYFAFTIGKISLSDYFDDNKYTHDPRTQFLSWSLMDAGAWDYPANTRGYTPSLVLEYIARRNEIRYAVSLEPLVSNGYEMNWDITKASGHTLEYTRRYKWRNRDGAIRLLVFFNTANMGNYRQSIALNPQQPVIENTRKYGNNKYGFAVNAEQDISDDLGCFFRGSWDDGRTETWAFTEIDQSFSGGFSLTGKRWKRINDVAGLAYVVSGISKPHRDYLQAGGKGFMLGDGNLNYGHEQLAELYYNAGLQKNHIYLTGAYQLLLNPGYNEDRKGPVNVFSVRLHVII